MQYYKNRVEAGKLLANQIVAKYSDADCAVVALGDGAVMVASPIAIQLQAVLTLLLTAPIVLPRENNVLASVNQEGGMTYNDSFSSGERRRVVAPLR